eukprot:362191-Chlamydomonas_euryale.AAC.6
MTCHKCYLRATGNWGSILGIGCPHSWPPLKVRGWAVPNAHFPDPHFRVALRYVTQMKRHK